MAGDDKDKDALVDLAEKVVQLTKVIVFLHTRSDGHETRCSALRTACEDEVKQVASAAAARVEEQRRHTAAASTWRQERLQGLTHSHEQRHAESASDLDELRAALTARVETARRSFTEADVARSAAVVEMRRRADRLRGELGAAECRARTDRQWLARQLAGEAARDRQKMDEAFEAESAHLKREHSQEIQEMRVHRENAVASLRSVQSEALAAAHTESESQLAQTLEQQSAGFENERHMLEEQSQAAQNELNAARAEASAAKDECTALQRMLDDMSGELQDRKRRSQLLSTEMDKLHGRRLRAETDARELRRQKVVIERALGGAGAVPQTERAVAHLSEDVRSAQTKLAALQNEANRTERLIEERRMASSECVKRVDMLSRELAEERRRSDELQRVLLRLE